MSNNAQYEILDGQTSIFDNFEMFGIEEPSEDVVAEKDSMVTPVAVPIETFLMRKKEI